MTSWLEIIPLEIKQKIFSYLSDSDCVKLCVLPSYKHMVSSQVNWERLDLDLFEELPLELIAVLKEVACQVRFLTWQIGHVWHFRRLSQTVSRFRQLSELDLSGNPQIRSLSFISTLQNLRALCLRCCSNFCAASLTEVVPNVTTYLVWLDVANCKQIHYWHIIQILKNAQSCHRYKCM